MSTPNTLARQRALLCTTRASNKARGIEESTIEERHSTQGSLLSDTLTEVMEATQRTRQQSILQADEYLGTLHTTARLTLKAVVDRTETSATAVRVDALIRAQQALSRAALPDLIGQATVQSTKEANNPEGALDDAVQRATTQSDALEWLTSELLRHYSTAREVAARRQKLLRKSVGWIVVLVMIILYIWWQYI